jgi:hypothetical protein
MYMERTSGVGVPEHVLRKFMTTYSPLTAQFPFPDLPLRAPLPLLSFFRKSRSPLRSHALVATCNCSLWSACLLPCRHTPVHSQCITMITCDSHGPTCTNRLVCLSIHYTVYYGALLLLLNRNISLQNFECNLNATT